MNRFELFASGNRIKPFISNELMERFRNPIIFLTPTGGQAYGYEADVLVELCEAVLSARATGDLQKQQLGIAQQCEMIIRGLVDRLARPAGHQGEPHRRRTRTL